MSEPMDAQGVPVLKVVCSWCVRLIRDGAEPVSHGICPDCSDALMASCPGPPNGAYRCGRIMGHRGNHRPAPPDPGHEPPDSGWVMDFNSYVSGGFK